MTIEALEKACSEVYRVLRNNGEFWIWDAKISENKGLFIIRLSITLLNGKKIRTAYGSRTKTRNLAEIERILQNTKSRLEIIENHQKWFFLKATKT